ncbi:Ctr copper transporter family-domain-containing protein [Ganoderma leucocontextum]|nr:Ctr copper transporter family-domain-containing protein [Ganoderma leucocontextum]
MDMSMASMSATGTAAAASTTSTGMSMSMSMGSSSCKVSMLWNWYTVDSCFISTSWHVKSKGAFAGSCIGVIILVIALEGLRRLQREFDRYLHRANGTSSPRIYTEEQSDTASRKGLNPLASALGRRSPVDQLKLWQQLLRSGLFMVQFAVGYFVMLLAMYYNGYMIICIFIGAFLGASIFQWDTYHVTEGPETRDSCCN